MSVCVSVLENCLLLCPCTVCNRSSVYPHTVYNRSSVYPTLYVTEVQCTPHCMKQKFSVPHTVYNRSSVYPTLYVTEVQCTLEVHGQVPSTVGLSDGPLLQTTGSLCQCLCVNVCVATVCQCLCVSISVCVSVFVCQLCGRVLENCLCMCPHTVCNRSSVYPTLYVTEVQCTHTM